MDSRPEFSLLEVARMGLLEEARMSQEEREYRYALRAYRSARRRAVLDGIAAAAATCWTWQELTGGSLQWWYATFMAFAVCDFLWSLLKWRRAREQRDLALVATVQES